MVDKQFIFSANYSAVNTTASIRRQASPADLVCRHRVDATLVGHEKAERKVCLAFSLLEHDDIAEVRPDLSPWLASLLIMPKYRAVIYGREFVFRCVEQARILGFLVLYLYTQTHPEYYARLGWRSIEQRIVRSETVTEMRKSLC